MSSSHPMGTVDADHDSQADADRGDGPPLSAWQAKQHVAVRKGYAAIGVGIIALCCVGALAVGQASVVAHALTVLAMIGAAIACCALEIRFKRPALGRTVLVACGAMAVLLLQPVTMLSSLL